MSFPVSSTMPSRTRTFTRRFVPIGTPSPDFQGPHSLEYLNSQSNWVVYPGTKRPNLTVQNPHLQTHAFVEKAWVTPGYFQTSSLNAFHCAYATTNPFYFVYPSQENEALARFNGKVRKGSASLGVTMASWRQSREMITSRCKTAADVLSDAYKDLSRSPARRKRLARSEREPLANEVLEGEFGWKPLIQDIRAALTTVCQDGIPPQWVVGRAKRKIYERAYDANALIWTTYQGESLVTVAASVSISNPNLWLLNRMGLINPFVVLWDLIPWSFLVNMFVNVNQMISSVTDEVGLTIGNRSTTYSCDLTREQQRYGPPGFSTTWPPTQGSSLAGKLVSESRVRFNNRSRTVGSFPQPQWQVKVPELNWELAAIASSLLLQKVQRLNNLVKGF